MSFGQLPPTQVVSDEDEFCDDCETTPCQCVHVEAEEDDERVPPQGSSRGRKIQRTSRFPEVQTRAPYKREREGVVGPYYEEDDIGPDIDEYLAQWDLPDSTKIGLCRTYANYLAQRTRTSKAPAKK